MNDDPVISPRYSQAREIARLKRRIKALECLRGK
jgi:hypothetical protein